MIAATDGLLFVAVLYPCKESALLTLLHVLAWSWEGCALSSLARASGVSLSSSQQDAPLSLSCGTYHRRVVRWKRRD